MEKFKQISLLGEGSYGLVYLVEEIDSKEKFAIKIIQKNN